MIAENKDIDSSGKEELDAEVLGKLSGRPVLCKEIVNVLEVIGPKKKALDIANDRQVPVEPVASIEGRCCKPSTKENHQSAGVVIERMVLVLSEHDQSCSYDAYALPNS